MNSKSFFVSKKIFSNIIRILFLYKIINFINLEIDKIIRLGDEDFR